MKFLVFCLLFTENLFADNFTLKNETSFQKISVEWASSAREVQESNDAILQEDAISSLKLYSPGSGKSKIPIPKDAAYFRILVGNGQGTLPEFVTNWVEIVPDKTYLLKDEHLTPILLMNGMGC